MALKEVDLIFNQATKSESHNQVIKSVFYELKYNSYLEEDDYILGIYRLEELIDKSPSPSKEILHSLTAEVYWGYYNANSWKFSQRTSLASDMKLDDVRTWDLKRIAKKVIHHYKASLNNSSVSQNESIDQFKEIIYASKDTKPFRPTLFDFLTHRAITFFSNNSFNVPGPAETYTINHKDYFSNNTRFLNLNVSTNDSLNTRYYASMGYKILTDFHFKGKNESAKLMLELDRIQYVNQNTTNPNREELYYNALTR